ncbi:MAG: RDD family protein [Actinomycetota bacterium]|nr:RDD family protein [Actinomycetota bacterium]
MSTTPPSPWRQQQPDWQALQSPPETQAAYPPPPPAPHAYGSGYSQPASALAEYAGWWRRFAAIIIDGLLLGIPLYIFAVATGLIEFTTDDITGELASVDVSPVWYAISILVPLLYYGLLEGGQGGASVGKMALGIKVRDADTGGPIGVGKAALRRFIYNILWYLLVIPGVINGLSPLWDDRKQSWHDKAVNSVVVRRR